jgi:hypothetical protein
VTIIIVALFFLTGMAQVAFMPHEHDGRNIATELFSPPPTPTPDPDKVEIEKLTIQRDTLTYQLEQENQAKISMNTYISAINKFLCNNLNKKGNVYYKAANSQEPQVSPVLLVAISLQEVGQGCNSPLIKRTGNVCGMNWTNDSQYGRYGRYVDYSNKGGVDASIWDMAHRISKYYIASGRCTISQIGAMYAPIDDRQNGMYGMNNNEWSANVTKYYNMILNEAKDKNKS